MTQKNFKGCVVMKSLKINFPIIKKLKGGLIAVFRPGIKILNTPEYRTAVIKAVETGGAVGIKCLIQDVRGIKEVTDLPVMVTAIPNLETAKKAIESGADILAINATDVSEASELIKKIKDELKIPVMAELATPWDGKVVEKAGVDMVSTDRCGYTKEEVRKREMLIFNRGKEYTDLLAKETEKEPDIEAVHLLSKELEIPVLCEGRIWTPEQACYALKAGAYAVIVGGSITKPNIITCRFVQAMDRCKTTMYRNF